MNLGFPSCDWALILGGSSGFGLATAQALSRHGMSVAIVHRDRKGAMEPIEREFEAMRGAGTDLLTFNVDALCPVRRGEVLDELAQRLGEAGRVRLLLHSIAFGNLKLMVPTPADYPGRAERAQQVLATALGVSPQKLHAALHEVSHGPEGEAATRFLTPAYEERALLEEEDFARTIHAMGTSIVGWTQELHRRGMFAPSSRVIGLTSEGNELAWRGYAAVAAAKAALESVLRSIAVEYAPYGVRANIIQPGVTETPALARIPGSLHMKAAAKLRNPCGRLTQPSDVAGLISLLCTDEAAWVNGALIRVDGGERIGA